jgi:hypothetical protein
MQKKLEMKAFKSVKERLSKSAPELCDRVSFLPVLLLRQVWLVRLRRGAEDPGRGRAEHVEERQERVEFGSDRLGPRDVPGARDVRVGSGRHLDIGDRRVL